MCRFTCEPNRSNRRACLLARLPLAKYSPRRTSTTSSRVTPTRLLGYSARGRKAVSVQGTCMGVPRATIVFEELVQLASEAPAVVTCGGRSPSKLGHDRRAQRRSGRLHACPRRQRSRTARPRLRIDPRRRPPARDRPGIHVCPIVSSDLFITRTRQYERWSSAVLAVEMEAAALFPIGASESQAGCP